MELLIVLVMAGIILGIAGSNFRGLENDLRNASSETAAYFRQTRSAAMSSTSAYRVTVASNIRLFAEFAADCSAATWQPDTRRVLDLREGVVMEGTVIVAGDVLLCYDARGVADASPAFVLRDREGRADSVAVFVGGAVVTTPIP